MNIKREIIALAVRLLADQTTLIRKPDAFESALNSIFNQESYDQALARQIESESERVVAAAKKTINDHKFKKITKNF